MMSIDEAIKHAREVAEENYKQGFLCHANPNDKELDRCVECGKQHEQLAKWLEELKRFKSLQDQGRLLELPCAVGDTVWTNSSMQGWYFREKDKPYKATVVFIGINGKENFMNVGFGNGHMLQFNFSDIGKRVFLTEEEAQKALEEIDDLIIHSAWPNMNLIKKEEVEKIIRSHMEDDGWIPVSQKLPDKDDWYWCTCYAPHRGYFTQPAQWDDGDFIKPCYKGIVVAWMEGFPEPYCPK